MRERKIKIKSGAASIYVVVFALLLFSVIVVAFAALINSEFGKSTDDILAQAAYDSALAGVEDAKLAMISYRKQLNGPNANNTKQRLDKIKGKCNGISNFIDRITENEDGTFSEVFVEATGSNSGSITEQAYTCVTIENNLSDYIATIPESTYRLIPLSVEQPSSISASEIESITLSWFSESDYIDYDAVRWPIYNEDESYAFENPNANGAPAPSILSVQFIQFPDSGIGVSPFGIGNDDVNVTNVTTYNATNRGEIWLVPTNATSIDNTFVTAPGGINAFAYSNDHKDGNANEPYFISCAKDKASIPADGFLCSATIPLPKSIGINGDGELSVSENRANDGTFLIVSLPYQQPSTTIKVTMNDRDGNHIKFNNVQVQIDSTGRANDVFSRVETRIEFTDSNYPLPTNTIQAFGSGGEALSKNFWASTNCWHADGDGEVKDCGTY